MQPERFAVAYQVGSKLFYQTITQNPGSLKIVAPFDETIGDGECPVSKTINISGISEEDAFTFEAQTSHPEWITTLEEDEKTLTICAKRAPLDGKFDLWLSSSSGYQYIENLSWQGASNIIYSPKAPKLVNWTFTPSTPTFAWLQVYNAKQLAVFERYENYEAGAETLQLEFPQLTGSGFSFKIFAQSGVDSSTYARSLDSINELPAVTLPASAIQRLEWDATNQNISWGTNATADVDFFELSVELGSSDIELVALLEKGQTSFKVPEIPAAVGTKPVKTSNVLLSAYDYKDYSNLEGWLDTLQNPAVTLEEYIAKTMAADKNFVRTSKSKVSLGL